jgi:hypothetical protein
MAIATWKDLCIDAVDATVLGRFWAGTLGLEFEALPDGDVRLSGPTPGHTIWINTVPEPVTVKQRVHLDVHAAAVDDVLGLGASPADVDSFRWKILHDPEGGELCVFVRDAGDARLLAGARLYEIGVDVADWRRIGRWWAEALGATYGEDLEQGYAWIEDIEGAPFEGVVFCPVPEPKAVKNRIHWDVVGEVDALVAAGATLVEHHPGWTVLADPEGNEFCAFAPKSA